MADAVSMEGSPVDGASIARSFQSFVLYKAQPLLPCLGSVGVFGDDFAGSEGRHG
jgi:hypothetical protein